MASVAVCRYCNKVELTFDNAFKSKTGKLIPLDKTSGLPHQCAENPFSHSQQQQQPQQPQTQQPQQQTTDLILQIKLVHQKLDVILDRLGLQQAK